jgi:hypothetical protein
LKCVWIISYTKVVHLLWGFIHKGGAPGLLLRPGVAGATSVPSPVLRSVAV